MDYDREAVIASLLLLGYKEVIQVSDDDITFFIHTTNERPSVWLDNHGVIHHGYGEHRDLNDTTEKLK